jgi:hypothetical protein
MAMAVACLQSSQPFYRRGHDNQVSTGSTSYVRRDALYFRQEAAGQQPKELPRNSCRRTTLLELRENAWLSSIEMKMIV